MLSTTSPRAKLEAKVLRWTAIVLATIAVLYGAVRAAPFVYRHNFETRDAAFTVAEKHFAGGDLFVMTNIHTYRCSNSLAMGKWDAMETFGALEIGHTYHARVVGLRVGFLGWYPSILSAHDLAEVILEPPEDLTEAPFLNNDRGVLQVAIDRILFALGVTP